MVGYDSATRCARARRSSGARSTSAARAPQEALDGADVCFVCCPVGAAAGAGRRRRSRPAATASSATSARPSARCSTALATRGLADRDRSRFVGGHPLAGAEAAGVEHAAADLFEGATWYLTPTDRTSGVHYDRLYRAISALGARPTAIDADTHDRLMATVSHLPHVLANVLVGQAARALLEEDAATCPPRDRASATPPAWRAQPAGVARHLPGQPRGDRGRARGLSQRAGAAERRCATATPTRSSTGSRARAPTASACWSPSSPAAPVSELRVSVPEPARHRRPDRARAGRGRREHRRHGALPGRRTCSPGRSRSGSRATERRARAELIEGLGYPAAVVATATSRPCGSSRRGALRGPLTPPPDKSISHRAALLGAMSEGTVTVRNYLRAARHRARRSPRSARWAPMVGPSTDATARLIRGAGLRGARAAGDRIDVGNAGTLLRLLPGWLAGQPAGTGRSTATRASGGVRRPGRRAAAAMGARSIAATGACRR